MPSTWPTRTPATRTSSPSFRPATSVKIALYERESPNRVLASATARMPVTSEVTATKTASLRPADTVLEFSLIDVHHRVLRERAEEQLRHVRHVLGVEVEHRRDDRLEERHVGLVLALLDEDAGHVALLPPDVVLGSVERDV